MPSDAERFRFIPEMRVTRIAWPALLLIGFLTGCKGAEPQKFDKGVLADTVALGSRPILFRSDGSAIALETMRSHKMTDGWYRVWTRQSDSTGATTYAFYNIGCPSLELSNVATVQVRHDSLIDENIDEAEMSAQRPGGFYDAIARSFCKLLSAHGEARE